MESNAADLKPAELNAQTVRDVRFGTTRMRAGYDMVEVDAFLDTIEAAIEHYSSEARQSRDEAEVLRSQVEQLQLRLAATQRELEQCQALAPERDHVAVGQSGGQHDTLITEIPGESSGDARSDDARIVDIPIVDTETTAENPVVRTDQAEQFAALLQVRDDVRRMLNEQLELVDQLKIEGN